jgi:hypothetical protein
MEMEATTEALSEINETQQEDEGQSVLEESKLEEEPTDEQIAAQIKISSEQMKDIEADWAHKKASFVKMQLWENDRNYKA